MMPSTMVISGPDIVRNGVPVTPRAQVSICEIQPCAGIASFGFQTKPGYLTFCRDHLPQSNEGRKE